MTKPRPTGTGATPVAGGSKRTLWPWLLLAAIVAALLVWWLIESLDDDGDDVDAGATTAVTETTEAVEDDLTETESETETEDAAPTSPTTVTVVPAGFVYVGDVDVLDPEVDPADLVGETVEGNTVDVVQLVADEAFYVGQPGQTIMVRLENFAGEGEPESPFEVEVGDQVSFTGTLQEIDQEFLDSLQLFEGVEQVELGDYYVQADDVTLVQ